nr:MAG TPA: hypothetical protein [Caudoviricetes sp.]
MLFIYLFIIIIHFTNAHLGVMRTPRRHAREDLVRFT